MFLAEEDAETLGQFVEIATDTSRTLCVRFASSCHAWRVNYGTGWSSSKGSTEPHKPRQRRVYRVASAEDLELPESSAIYLSAAQQLVRLAR